ncbi:MAG: ribonuclease P protein component [bacterium]
MIHAVLRYGLSPEERLRKGKEIRAVCDRGRKIVAGCFVLLYRENGETFDRLGTIASRKIGNHPERNRAKRLLREVFRRNKPRLESGYDLVIIARYKIKGATYHSLNAEFLSCLNKAELIRSE